MGIFSFLRRKKEPSENEKIAWQAGIIGELQRPQTEQEMIEALGINYHMIHDDYIEKPLLVGFSNEKEFNHHLAMKAYSSSLYRTSFLDPLDVEIYKLEIECGFDDIEIDLDEESYEKGELHVINAYRLVSQNGVDDAKFGRKAKLLKAYTKELTVKTSSESKGGKIL
ncbi:MAG: hypothetical protein DRJ18_00180 [Candidatus Methanomethylicota archaeon]|nr:MAG: hypothetical protein DRJ18_00180 [Candidatus Verstraetearchaeota archaeon]